MKARDVWRSSFVIASLLSAGTFASCTASTSSVGGSGGNGQTASGGSGGGSSNNGSGGSSSNGTGNGSGKASGGSGAGAGPGSGTGGGTSTTGSGGTGGGTTAGTGGAPGTGGAVAVVPIDGSNPPAEGAGTMVMRRLTYREYDHMLNELFGDLTAPAETGDWSPDAQNPQYFVVPSSVADLQVDLYGATADTVVDTALSAVTAGKTAGKFAIPCKTAPTTTAAETTCATQFITTFGLPVYRRPVSAAEQTDLLAVFSKVRALGLSFNASLGAIAKAMIQSPNFLYHWEIGPTKPVVGSDGLAPLTQWQIASRLASALWETMPDDTLLQAAQAGQLNTPAAVSTQVTRMLADARAANGLFTFHEQWLFNFGSQGRDLTSPLNRANTKFTAGAAGALPTEFAQFIASVYGSGDGTLQTLFTAPYAFVNADLAAIYGVTPPASGFAKVNLDPAQRAGILTQTAFLATMGNDAGRDNPVYRGITIYLKVLCGQVMDPPPNVPPVQFIMNGTTRQSYDKHGSSDCAKSCHGLFDPPGFAFENYDGIGAYRTTEATLPVDSTGTFQTPGNTTITFKNAVDLVTQLAQSKETQTCVDRQWTRYLLGRGETAAESGSMSLAFQKAAATNGFSLRDMLATLLTSKAFMYRQPSPGEAL